MFESCLKCGVCYDNCYLEHMGIPSFVRLLVHEDTASLWTCSNCLTCQDSCPAGIPLMELKWQMQQEVKSPPLYTASLANIRKCGYCLPVDPADINSFRIDDGLDPLTLAPLATIDVLLQNKWNMKTKE
jgi:ferredoxin